LGRLSSAKAPTGQVLFSYDAFGRTNAQTFVDEEGINYVEKTTFNADGTPFELELSLPDTGYQKEAFKYGYDSAARPRSIKFFEGSSSLDLYEASVIDPFGRVRQAKYAGKIDYTANYADLGRRLMRDVTVSSPLGARNIEYLIYDPLEREEQRKEIRDGGASASETNVAYDQLGELLVRTVQNQGSNQLSGQGFAYDPLGNIVAVTDPQGAGAAAFNYDTNDRDRICRIGYGNGGLGGTACNVVYDGVGNIIKEPTRTGSRDLTYYASGRIRTTEEHKAKSQFRYDALGNLQELDVEGTGVTDTRHDRHYGSLIERRDAVVGGSTQSFISRQVPGPGGIVASRRGNSNDWVFYFGEPRGNRFFTDQNGAFLQDIDYQSYGEAKSSGAQLGSPQYTSAQWNGGDALAAFGLSYLGARLYDPVIGRFLSRDPLLVPRTAATTNPYAFALNDPVNLSDPSGLDSCGADDLCITSSNQDSVSAAIGAAVGVAELLAGSAKWAIGAIGSSSGAPQAPRVTSSFPQTHAGMQAYLTSVATYGGVPAGFNFDTAAANGKSMSAIMDMLAETTYAHAVIDEYNARLDQRAAYWRAAGLSVAAFAMGGAAVLEVAGTVLASQGFLGAVDAEAIGVGGGTATVAAGAGGATGAVNELENESEVLAADTAVAEGDSTLAAGPALRASVNPTGGTTNCVNCAIATDARLAGNPSSAMSGGPSSLSVLESRFRGAFQPVSGPTDIENILYGAGNGARGIVYGASPYGNVGHVWNVIHQSGVIRYLDGQTGIAGEGTHGNFNLLKNFSLLITNPVP
jgi:RHS repeat-associated protein